MKILNKSIVILAMSVVICMGGCTAEQTPNDTGVGSEEPGQTETPTDNIAPTDGSRIVENEFIAVNVGNKWEEVPVEIVSNSITLVRSASEGINVLPVPLPQSEEDITVEDYKPIVQDTLSLQPELKVSKIEVENREIGKVIYYEGKIELTPDEINTLINKGTYSQDIVNEYGGASEFAKAINMDQVAIYYIDNGKCVAITGQATNGADISPVKEEVEAMINTVVFK